LKTALAIDKVTPTIGAEISGVDLKQPLSAGIVRAIKQALWDHQVIFFRNQRLTAEALHAFAKRLGRLSAHPSTKFRHPRIHELTFVTADETSTQVFGLGWHTDQSAQETPPIASLLYVTEAPDLGGDTLWSSMYAAYEALSQPMKTFLGGLTAFHNGLKPAQGYVMAPANTMLHNEHPVVTRHPETGRPALFVNRFQTTHIPQLTWSESEALLSFLYAHAEQPRFQCRFRWRDNSLALWDNRAAQHTVVWDYYPKVRRALRATLAGPAVLAMDPVRALKTNEQPKRSSAEFAADFMASSKKRKSPRR
jgi:taurine dioxygenase